MKKTLFTASCLLAAISTLMLFTISCDKKIEEVVPTVNVATNVVLNNQNGTEYKYVKLGASSVTIVTSTGDAFDLGYFSGYDESDKYYFSSDYDYSTAIDQPTRARLSTTYTTYYTVSGINFDALTSIADLKKAIEDGGKVGADGTELASPAAWEVGYTFGFITRDGIYGLAKVTTAPTGYNYYINDVPVVEVPVVAGGRTAGWSKVAGSVTLSIKYVKI